MIESVKPSYSPTPTRTTPDRQANDGLDQRMHWSVDYVEPGANVWSSAGSLRVARHFCCIVETNWTVTRFRVGRYRSSSKYFSVPAPHNCRRLRMPTLAQKRKNVLVPIVTANRGVADFQWGVLDATVVVRWEVLDATIHSYRRDLKKHDGGRSGNAMVGSE